MRRLLTHLAVALVAFVIGVKLAWAFGALFGPAVSTEDVRPVYVAPRAVKVRSCPTAPRVEFDVPPPPPAPAPPAARRSSKQTRIVIRRDDGTVQVVEKP